MHTTHVHPPCRLRPCVAWFARLLPAVLALAALAAPARVLAGQFATTTISPASQNATVGTPFSVSIVMAVGSTPAYGVQAWVAFDKTKLQVVSVTTGASSPFTSVFANAYDNANGTLTYGATGGNSGGTITVATIVFNPIAAGTASIGYQNVNEYLAGYGPYGVNGLASGGSVSITAPVVKAFGSGISPVTAWDPIFPAAAYANAAALSTPTQTVGPLPNDPRWANPHPASVFPKGTHPWEFTPPMNFDANWINAWNNITSQGPAGQNWTKYSTTVTGEGSFVLQFLADNVSWIYLDGTLVGYQDWNWQSVGTGRYTINLTGAGPHELVFIIWDGGGAAGGKFRIETLQSFVDNGGTPPPPPPPSDTTPPVITAPADITAEATSAAGAAVTFSASAVDAVDGPVNVVANPASGSTFGITTTIVGLAASDTAGNTATASFKVTVKDTIAPALILPGSVTAEATSASGAPVSYPAATATDAVGVTSIAYSQNSGTQFALGTTTVNVTAKDAANNTSTGSFTVAVQDTIAPALTVPANVTAEATSANGAIVSYPAATAIDAVGVAAIAYSQNSGTQFPLGSTTVNVSAKDAANNTSAGSFTVTVKDTTAPALSVPANITTEATSAAGAAVSYPAATATDAVGVASLTYSAASGSTFALGANTVTVTAKDAAGNTTTGSFTITVVDTTAPALTVPASQTLEATSAAGAVATFNASATDAVGVVSLTTSSASGSTFPIGTTTVTVTAKDAAGNTSTSSFTIKVVDTTAPAIASVTPSTATLWPPNHQMVAINVNAVASDVVGIASLKIVNVTSSEPDNGLGDGDTPNDIQITGDLTLNLRAERSGKGSGRVYTITVEARDAAGNPSTKTCTVSVAKSQGGK